jgi:cation-transporting P-type ATPase 13A2
MEVYVKGAPEVMSDICEKSSCEWLRYTKLSRHPDYIDFIVPHDYEDLLSYYTKRGYRVIAIAGKSIEGLSWLKAQRMKRQAFNSSACSLH